MKRAISFTIQLLISCLISIWIGYKIDTYLHTTPLCIILCLLYVIIGSIYLLVKELGHHEDRR